MNRLMCTFIIDSRRFQMKFLKILLILLVPAMGFVACQKSERKPECSSSKAKESGSATNSGSKLLEVTSEDDDSGTGIGTLVGSGDDDRDGGDKRKKTR